MSRTPAHAALERYLELVNAKAYDRVGSLFTEDAVVLSPSGETVRGKVAITALWAEQFSKAGPESVVAASVVCEGNMCVAELSPTLPGEQQPTPDMVVDHFTVDEEGRITRLAIYLRPTS